MTSRARRAAALAAGLLLPACAVHRAAPPAFPPPAEPHVEPDVVGSVHVVKKGETLYRIARTYGLEPADLMDANDISDPRTLAAGTELFIPGALRPLEVPPPPPGALEPVPEPKREPVLSWPLHGAVYSRFGIRQGQRHDGIDISAPDGAVIGASAPGTVVYAGEQSGYGSIVILRHPGGLVTLYAHASAVLVKEGNEVTTGSPIARVGHSGRTTGPHLHFEVREGTRPRNPLLYLP